MYWMVCPVITISSFYHNFWFAFSFIILFNCLCTTAITPCWVYSSLGFSSVCDLNVQMPVSLTILNNWFKREHYSTILRFCNKKWHSVLPNKSSYIDTALGFGLVLHSTGCQNPNILSHALILTEFLIILDFWGAPQLTFNILYWQTISSNGPHSFLLLILQLLQLNTHRLEIKVAIRQ